MKNDQSLQGKEEILAEGTAQAKSRNGRTVLCWGFLEGQMGARGVGG